MGKTYLTSRATAQKYRVDGLIPSSNIPNQGYTSSAFSSHALYGANQLPGKVDLRSGMTPVENQSAVGSCVANSFVGAYEFLTKKDTGTITDFSRLFIYYNARVEDQKSRNVVDAGCTFPSAIKVLKEMGTCLESTWPYNIAYVNQPPNAQGYQEAQSHKIIDALPVRIDLNEMKSSLAQGFPFAFGMKLFGSFDRASTTGVVPMPNQQDTARQAHGSHALLAVGYSNRSNSFIVRNSWGEGWGAQGYCYIPYEYMTDPNLCFDAWTVRKVATDNNGREEWDSDDSIDYRTATFSSAFGSDFDTGDGIIETVDENEEGNSMDQCYDSSQQQTFNEPWYQQGYNQGNQTNYSQHPHRQESFGEFDSRAAFDPNFDPSQQHQQHQHQHQH